MALTPVLLYLADEASSGTTPTTIGDTSAGTPLNLTITYGTGAAWKSIGAGKGIGWATSGNTGAVSGPLNGTKVEAALAGATKATWEIVIDPGSDAANEVLAYFGGSGAYPGLFVVQRISTGEIIVYVNNAQVAYYTISSGVSVITVAVDTDQAVAADRITLSQDGSPVTPFLTNYPAQHQAIDALQTDYSQNVIALGCYSDPTIQPATGSSLYFAKLYASALTSAEVAANATALAANNDADPNGAPSADKPFVRRRQIEEPPEEARKRRAFLPIVPAAVVDNPPRFRRRALEPMLDEEPRRRRPFVPIPVAVVNDQSWVRARRPLDDAQEERAARRCVAPIIPAVTPDNPPPHASSARARMLADESRVEPDPRPRKPMQRPAGLLSITTDTSTATVDLTAIGTSDWRTWVGTTTPGDAIRKVSGGNQISDWSPFGGAPSWTPGVEPAVVQWSDGDPVPVGSHSGILSTIGSSGGFYWTVPASPTVRTLHLYLDVIAGGSYANIAAFMSDGTSNDTFLGNFVDGEWNVHIAYSTPNPSATLTVYFVPGGASTECRVRGLALAGPAVPNDMPFIRRLWQRLATWDTEEPRARKRFAPIPPPAAPDNPPPRTTRRREEEPESIVGRIVRKLVPPPPAVVNDPPPRAGRSNWRVAWDTWEPLEIIRRAVRRMLFPGVIPPVSPVLENPLSVDFDDTELTIDFDDGTLSVDFDE